MFFLSFSYFCNNWVIHYRSNKFFLIFGFYSFLLVLTLLYELINLTNLFTTKCAPRALGLQFTEVAKAGVKNLIATKMCHQVFIFR